MPLFDLIIAVLWIGGLTVFLLGQALIGWSRLRYARRCARHAKRLSEATRPFSRSRAIEPSTDELLPLGGRPPLERPQK